MCCWRTASGSGPLGGTPPKAQMIFLLGVEATGIVKASLGLFPDSTLSDGSDVAVRGGFGSTVGICSDGACRCDNVIDPSAFGHMMTIGVFAICEPKPLHAGSAPALSMRLCPYAHCHPLHLRLAYALQRVFRAPESVARDSSRALSLTCHGGSIDHASYAQIWRADYVAVHAYESARGRGVRRRWCSGRCWARRGGACWRGTAAASIVGTLASPSALAAAASITSTAAIAAAL